MARQMECSTIGRSNGPELEEMDCGSGAMSAGGQREAQELQSRQNGDGPKLCTCTAAGSCHTVSGANRKRAREEEPGAAVEKRGCEEGMSWWTCLLLGVDPGERSQQQVVRKLHENY